MNKYLILGFCGMIFAGSGCETLSGQQRRQREIRLKNDIANLKASVERIERRLDGIEEGREDLYSRISCTQKRGAKSEAQHQAEIDALESQLAAQRAEQDKMRKDLVAKLSEKMETIIKSQTATAYGDVSGVVHTVQSGETLSAIAAAYGVKSTTIIKVNRLKNPDDLKIGQRLTIPD
jgi:LysM repeat protein